MKLNKNEKLVFIVSFLFLVILGILLSYNYDFTENYNLLFDSDTARVIGDAISPSADHNRLDVHPLFMFWVQPVIFILSGIFQNKMLALIILSAFITSISTLYIYRILKLIKNDDKINLLLTGIYLFSFSNIIFTVGMETYNYAVVFLILFWYYLLKTIKEKKEVSLPVIILFGLATLSFTITNYVVFAIGVFLLWILKKVNIKKAIIIGIIPLCLLVALSGVQKVIWQNTPFIIQTNIRSEKNNFSETTINKNNFKNVIEKDYETSLIANDMDLKIEYGTTYNGLNYILVWRDTTLLHHIIYGLFYLGIILLIIRNFKKNVVFNVGLILTLGFNTALHLLYGNQTAFLYSLNFIYEIILLLGINLLEEKNTKLKKGITIGLFCFLIGEIIKNIYIYSGVLYHTNTILNANKLIMNLGLFKTALLEIGIVLLIGLLVYFIIKLWKNKKKKILIIGLLFIIELIFISLETMNTRFLWIPLTKDEQTIPKDKAEYLEKDFKEYFKEELVSLETYKNEYNEFKNTYAHEETKENNWSDYFYFGLGNRRKLYYTQDKIRDMETKEVIYSFSEKEHMIIPNDYSVLIETNDHDFIKIYEDEEGVHFKKNDQDELIEGTSTKINLYTFENQKYQNMKKVLYQEILWNIKDSTIYPNIIVYDKPWYRDAAMAAMVLKQTNNTDLIKEWVDNIEDIYDRQNAGIEEADNLGELLYIISTQNTKNASLITKIEEEAERIASSNPNGYYIYGKTDFGDTHLYQNLWYQLGIESVGRKFKFDLSSIPEDEYSKMAWWSSYEVKNKTPNVVSINYPYLSMAERHKLGVGTIAINSNLYPLSWEKDASQAKYENYSELDNTFANLRLSPLHTWEASEMLLFLLEETNDLKRG